jgi:hypothetical protein
VNDDDFLRWLRVKQEWMRIAFLLPSRVGGLAFLFILIFILVILVILMV